MESCIAIVFLPINV